MYSMTRCKRIIQTSVLAGIVLGGCSSSDVVDPVDPMGRENWGSIRIECIPSGILASWAIAQDAVVVRSGEGAASLDVPEGEYSLHWHPPNNWAGPDSSIITVSRGDTLTVRGEFTQIVASITIDIQPDESNGEWYISGPEGSSGSGHGDHVLTDLQVGEYMITWGNGRDSFGYNWLRPADETIFLTADDSRVVTGSFVRESGTLLVDLLPEDIAATWRLESTRGLLIEGAGDSTLVVPPDRYEYRTGALAGYSAPEFGWVHVPKDSMVLLQIPFTPYNGPPEPAMVRIAPGTFVMGAPSQEADLSIDDGPAHQVTLTYAFEIQNTEVTRRQFKSALDWAISNGYARIAVDYGVDFEDHIIDLATSPNLSLGPLPPLPSTSTSEPEWDMPVVNVTWYVAAAYCDWLNWREGMAPTYRHHNWELFETRPQDAAGFRLPTEAEWEYACRAGSSDAFANGPMTDSEYNDPLLSQIGWYGGNTPGGTSGTAQRVGLKIPNAWGLYDMHGNAYEWCHDWSQAYSTTNQVDPSGPATGSDRIFRGGAANRIAGLCRSAVRWGKDPLWNGQTLLGIRPVRTTQ